MADGKGPWGQGKKSGGKGKDTPWGQKDKGATNTGNNRPGSDKPRPDADLDEMLRDAQARISSMLGGGRGGRGGNNGRGGGRRQEPLPLGKILIVGLIIYALTGFYRVLPEENAVIKTFGEWTSTQETPGLGYHMPWPIQTVEKVNVTFERRIEIGFRGEQAPRGSRSTTRGSGDIPSESLMLTGDENIIDIDFVVLWRVQDAGKFLFAIRDPENTIKKVAESAMREIIGRTRIQQALTEARAQIEQDAKALMQTMLDSYESGIVINDVQLQQVDPPGPVVDAFDDVQRARADRERLRNEAEAYRNDILPRARGQAEQIIQQAEAYREEVMNRASGDAERFTSVYQAYAQDKDVTAERLYIETLEDILSNTQKILIDGDQGNVLPYLPLNELRTNRNSASQPAEAGPRQSTFNQPANSNGQEQ